MDPTASLVTPTPMPDAAIPYVVAVFALAIGSFLNVCIYRLPRHESLAMPASHCTACGRPLHWYENIPVLAYVVLRGRCGSCGVRISAMYPLIEITAAVIAVAFYLQFGLTVLFAARVIFAFALLVLFVIDLQHRVLPNVITLPGIIVGFLFSLVAPPGWRDSLIGVVAGGGFLYLLAEAWWLLRHEEAMGFGDVKMLGMIGAFLGWQLMIFTLMLASLLGSIIGVGVIVAGRGDRKSQLPFGTFLALAGIAACLVGEPLVTWYIDRVWR